MDHHLRAPLPADFAELVGWIPDAHACARWAGPNLRFPFVAAELPALLRVKGASDWSFVDFAGRLVGFGQYWPRNPVTLHLGRIIVAPHARGRGMGRVLLEQLMAEAVRAARPDVISLKVYRDNPAALALYRSLGFVAIEAESNAEVLAMERHLGPS